MLLMQAGQHAPASGPPGGAATLQDPVCVEQVMQVVLAALSTANGPRQAAEGILKGWESDAAPGFLSSLLQIVAETVSIEVTTRLLAVVIAKNAVGSSWRKTLGTREWSRVPPEEKQAVRLGAMTMLMNEPNPLIARHLGLLIANIARFDFPTNAEGLLLQLIRESSWESPRAVVFKLRALKALRDVLTALATKRFVIEPVRGGLADLRSLSHQITLDRELFRKCLSEAFHPLQLLFSHHLQHFLNCSMNISLNPNNGIGGAGAGEEWKVHAEFARSAAAAIAELLPLAPDIDGVLPNGAVILLNQIHGSCSAIMAKNRQPDTTSAMVAWREMAGKLSERMVRVVLVVLETYPVPFAECVPTFLDLFVKNALVEQDAAAVRAMRPKLRVLLVRFIAKCLLNPFYRPEWVEAPCPAGIPPSQAAAVAASKAKAGAAHAALSQLVSSASGQCAALVEALVGKYIALSGDEVQEWQADPESYARSMDSECSPDADAPRPIGVGLLLCMLENGDEAVANALTGLALRLQQQPPSPESILMREACYRCIGEGFQHIAPHVHFNSWYSAELEPQLSVRLPEFITGGHDIYASVLQARALWLLGVCGSQMTHMNWCSAYRLVVAHLGARDLVIALTSVTSLLGMTALILDDQAVLERYEALSKPKATVPGMMNAMNIGEGGSAGGTPEQQENESVAVAARARVEERMGALSETLAQALAGAFSLLARLTEVESMVRVLQLVSVLVEVMGTRILPQLSIISDALPRVWLKASVPGSGGVTSDDTGAIVRLHSALIAVLTHLVSKLRSAAMNDPRIPGVVFPLLQHSTSLSGPESECLVEEAFRLWNTALSSLPEVTAPLLQLLPNLSAVLRRGKDNAQVFPILENYLLLNRGNSLDMFAPMISAALSTTVKNAMEVLVGSITNSAAPSFSPEVAQEAITSAALSDAMLQLFPAQVPVLLLETFTLMAQLIAEPSLPAAGLPVKVMNVMEAFIEVLSRLTISNPDILPRLLGGDPLTLARYVDKWLVIASARFLEEIIGVKTMAMLGRFRRRIATIALATMVTSNQATQTMLMPPLLNRVCALAIMAVQDNSGFQTDQMEMDALDFKSDLQEDFVLVKRLGLMRADVVRNVNIKDVVKKMLQKIGSVIGGEDALLAAVSSPASQKLATQIKAILSDAAQVDSGDEDFDDNDQDDDDELEGLGSPGQDFSGVTFPSRDTSPDEDLEED